ncbi:MAG TPA: aldehyde dehydrogenase family protein [Polyangiaceae bacterium]|jgi:acyl-CoA reductase-like NAD-dependent aldehyde dehydrogenase|nr:aldehyde dehydrogenase family protein [Polyangiaceae bacterium]
MLQQYRTQIAGELRTTDQVEVIKNPFNGEPVAEVGLARESELELALTTAHEFFERGARPATHERAELLLAIAQKLREHAKDLAELITRESGKPIRYARAEVSRAVLTFTLGSGASRTLGGEVLPIDQLPGVEGKLCLFERVPRGPIAAISPFNFPINLVAHKLSPALAVGAPTILKPAQQSPLTAHALGELLLECGMQGPLLSILHMRPEVAEKLVTDERMAVLSFTGSDSLGFRLKSIAGKKHVLLELGGNAPCVIDRGVNLDALIPRVSEACWANAGQVCIKAQRIFVHRALFADFVEKFVKYSEHVVCGDPLRDDTVVGPLIEARHVSRVLDWVQEAKAGGAKILLGGNADGQLVRPIILTNTTENMRVCRDEIFGPVAIVEAVDSFDDAIAACNRSRFGLQAGIFTADVGHALKAFRALRYGGVLINDTPMLRVDNYPYGGVKDSGIGREGVAFAVEEFTEPKVLVLGAPPA